MRNANSIDNKPGEMMRKFIAAFCFLIATSLAQAGDSEGPVSDYLVGSNGMLFFNAGAHNNKPSCSVHGWVVALAGPNAAGGKAILAVILAAKAAGKSVRVMGSGVCDVWGDRETAIGVQVF